MAHKWAKWLRHPCRLGDPHRLRARGNQKWPTCGQSGYVTPAVSGIPTAAEPGAGKSEVAHLWAKWLCHPCRLEDSHRYRAGGGNEKWPTSGQSGYVTPAISGMRTAAERGGGDQKCPTCGQCGYVTPAVSEIPTASERDGGGMRRGPQVGKLATSPLPSRGSPPLQSGGGKSELALLWAKWLCHPCRLGDPHRCKRGGNQKWPTSGQSGYVTPAVSGIPTALERGAKSEVAHLWAKWLRHACRLGDAHRFRAGGELEVVHKSANWLRHPCRLGDPHRFRAGGKIRSGPLVGEVATSPLPSRGLIGPRPPPIRLGSYLLSPWLRHQSGYVTLAVSGIPIASEWGTKTEVAHKWAKGLRHPCRLEDTHRCREGEEIRSGPLVGKVAMSPLRSRGSPPLQSGGGGSGGVHKWAQWLRHPCRLGDPHRFRAGGGG